jgi:cytochrome P450
LLEELDTVLQGRPPTYDGLNECHYLTACLSEALRLHPSVPFDIKSVVKDDVFPSGVAVKAGDSAGYCPYAMARLSWVWGADAAEFNPSRWLDDSGAFVRADAFKYPVFQAGPRQCLGVDMAMLEMKVVVSILLPQLHLTVLQVPKYRTGLVLQMTEAGLKTQPVRR